MRENQRKAKTGRLLERKLISDNGQISFNESPTEAVNEQDS